MKRKSKASGEDKSDQETASFRWLAAVHPVLYDVHALAGSGYPVLYDVYAASEKIRGAIRKKE